MNDFDKLVAELYKANPRLHECATRLHRCRVEPCERCEIFAEICEHLEGIAVHCACLGRHVCHGAEVLKPPVGRSLQPLTLERQTYASHPSPVDATAALSSPFPALGEDIQAHAPLREVSWRKKNFAEEQIAINVPEEREQSLKANPKTTRARSPSTQG